MRMMLGLVLMGLVGALTFVADTFTFSKKPPGLIEKMVALPSLLGYQVANMFVDSGDVRVASDVFAFIFYLLICATIGFTGWRLMVKHFLEPWEIKEYWRRKVRRQELLDEHWPQN